MMMAISRSKIFTIKSYLKYGKPEISAMMQDDENENGTVTLDDNFHLQVDEPLTESQAVDLEDDKDNIGAETITCSMNETESLDEID